MNGAWSGHAGPALGSWVKVKGGTLVGRAVGFDLRTDEYVVIIPPTKTRGSVRMRFRADEIRQVEAPR